MMYTWIYCKGALGNNSISERLHLQFFRRRERHEHTPSHMTRSRTGGRGALLNVSALGKPLEKSGFAGTGRWN